MNKRSTKFYRKNEAEVMKRLGLKPTKNSGAGWVEKCDGQSEDFICELKSTDKESYTLKQKTLHELEYHACVAHKIPLFAFQFLNRDEVWVAIKEEDIQAYRGLIERDVLNKLEEEDSEFLKKYKISKNGIDKPLDKTYNKGEKERGGFEANSFMPHTYELSNSNNNKNNNVNNNNLDVNMLDIDVSNTDKLNNLDSNSNRNSDTKQSINVINGTNVIDVNKVKHNINARNNYFKQKEQERRKQEQKFKQRMKEKNRSLEQKGEKQNSGKKVTTKRNSNI